jgi:hypothetical protein
MDRELGRALHEMWRKNLEVCQHPGANKVLPYNDLDLKTQQVWDRTADEFLEDYSAAYSPPKEHDDG